jgi:hypothetical protein
MLAQQPASTTISVSKSLETQLSAPRSLAEKSLRKPLKAANPVEVNYVQSEEEI